MSAEGASSAESRRSEPLATRAILGLVRLGFRGMAAVAPHLAERRAAELFARPRRRNKRAKASSPALRIPFRTGELAVWLDGPKAGPLVLLAHGWEGDSRQFDTLAALLQQRGFRVARFDQPAHGLSAGKRATIIDFRDAVLRVGSELGPVSAVVGHSLGAAACVLAMTEGLAVKRVALLAPAREPRRFIVNAAELLGLAPARRDGMIEIIRQEIGEFDALDVVLRARDRSEPVLIVHAWNDRVIPFEEGQAIAAAWRGPSC